MAASFLFGPDDEGLETGPAFVADTTMGGPVPQLMVEGAPAPQPQPAPQQAAPPPVLEDNPYRQAPPEPAPLATPPAMQLPTLDLGPQRAQVRQAQRGIQRAQQEAQQATAELGQLDQEALARQQAMLQGDIQAQQVARRQMEEEVNRRLSEIDKTMQDITNSEVKANPQLLSRRERATFWGGIGMALGALGQAIMGGGPNIAARVTERIWSNIDKEIQNDIDRQKEALNKKYKGLSLQQKQLQNLRALASDEQSFDKMLYAMKLQALGNEIEARKQVASNKKELASLQLLGEQNKAKLATVGADLAKTEFQANMGMASLAANQRMAEAKARAEAEGEQLLPPELAVRTRPGIKVSGEEARNIRDRVADTVSVFETVNQMERDAKAGYFSKKVLTEEAGRLEAARAQLNSLLKTTENLGVLQAGDLKFLESMAGDPTALTSTKNMAKLKQIKLYVNNRMRNRLKTVGYVPGAAWTRTFKGANAPTR